MKQKLLLFFLLAVTMMFLGNTGCEPDPEYQYTISVSANPSAGGTVTGGGIYNEGTIAAVRAVANTGFIFKNWTEDGIIVHENATYTFEVWWDCILVANFEPAEDPDDPVIRNLWVNDLNNGWEQITTTRRYQSSRANVWVRDGDFGTGANQISSELINLYGDYFTDTSWDVIKENVYEITQFFGEEGDRINILFYFTERTVAGYFWSKDFFSDEEIEKQGLRSNETNIFYMNIGSAVNPDDQNYATKFTRGTLTHEFQHMAQAHYFTFDPVGSKQLPMDLWANELCSVLMESLFSDQAGIYVNSYNNDSSFENGVQFIRWDNEFNQYTAVSLLGTFLYSQISQPKRRNFISTWLRHSGSGNTSIHDLIPALEDSAVGYLSGSTDPEDNVGVQANWKYILKQYSEGLIGLNTAYNTLLDSLTEPGTSIDPVLSMGSGQRSLEASALLISKVSANPSNCFETDNMAYNYRSEGANNYFISVHNGLPWWENHAFVMPAIEETCWYQGLTAVRILSKSVPYEQFKYNRTHTGKPIEVFK